MYTITQKNSISIYWMDYIVKVVCLAQIMRKVTISTKNVYFSQKCLFLGPAKSLFEHQLMANFALIVFISIKINCFHQKILSKCHLKIFQNFGAPILITVHTAQHSIYFQSEYSFLIGYRFKTKHLVTP